MTSSAIADAVMFRPYLLIQRAVHKRVICVSLMQDRGRGDRAVGGGHGLRAVHGGPAGADCWSLDRPAGGASTGASIVTQKSQSSVHMLAVWSNTRPPGETAAAAVSSQARCGSMMLAGALNVIQPLCVSS